MIPIVFATDHNYLMPTGVSIASLLLNREDQNYDIRILVSGDVTDDDKMLLAKQISVLDPSSKVLFREMKSEFEDGFEIRGISKVCYYRLLIPWIFPDLDKVIYSDGDVIFKSNLENLFNIEIEKYFVAGAIPYPAERWKQFKTYFQKHGIDYKGYVNSGVLVINCKLQRENQLKQRYEKLAHNKYLFQDQDIINKVCKDKIGYFNNKYNLKPSLYLTKKEFSDDVIVHYAGDKPWKHFTYAWDLWWNVYEKSLFFDKELYHKITREILNPISHIKKILKKGKQIVSGIILKRK